MGRSVGSLLVIRRALNAFCENHHLPVEDETAIEAAQQLIAMVRAGESGPDMLLAGIEEWFSDRQGTAAALAPQADNSNHATATSQMNGEEQKSA
ncbi:hypothetical protein [Neorhizobium alkalisoli]|uniref:Uncharacterized protein n=1 Tax=Neorhizobium alkalisoli TaxID=528178 RepID=A0A561QGE7_9HYPH|nr:hypothetical protein [Neorhizobium alkalisoli]TWF49457.1 hypothetical protein FHW37_108127 [Neorhizobium alkalisoli]